MKSNNPANQLNLNDRIELILKLNLKLINSGFTHANKISEDADQLEAILLGLETLEKELDSKMAYLNEQQKRTTSLLEVLLRYTMMDFSQQIEIGEKGDELDAIALGLNTLGEELEGYMAQLQVEKAKMIAQFAEGIAERKKGEDKYKELLESAPDAIVIADKDGIIQLVNAQTERMFQFSREEMIGNKIEILMPKSLAGKHPGHRQHFFAAPKPRGMGDGLELLGVRKNGEEFPVEISLSPLTVEEGVWVAATVRDITDKKKATEELKEYARKLKQSNNSLEQFAYVASHDLQEPLRNITNFAMLLEQYEKNKLDATAVKYLGFIVTGAERMKVLIKDLLLYSRLGKQHVIESIDFNEVLINVLTDLDFQIKENNAVIKSGHLPVLLSGKTEIKLLFQNLIGNAIKYKKIGIVPVIEINAEKQPDCSWLFSVKDNGIGIAEEFKERIFIIFQRLHNQEEYPGTGIGLATCKKVVELNGGTLWVESKPGQGSTFYFTLPKTPVSQL